MTADVPGLIDEQITTNGANRINAAKLNAVLKDVTQAGTAIINVNNINTKAEAYEDAATARDAVPESMRKAGAKITYLLAAGWMEDQFNGADISGWGTASNWKTTGPVSVSQNTLTGDIEITIGNLTYQFRVFTDVADAVYSKVVLDAEGKLICGIKKADGDIYFGVGCPNQIKEYIQNNLELVYQQLNAKVDKVSDKSLIDAEYAGCVKVINDPVWSTVVLDAEGKIVSGIRKDGTNFPQEDTPSEENPILSDGNYNIITGQNIMLPLNSSNIELRFKTTESIYKQATKQSLLSIKGLLDIELEPVSVGDAIYYDNSKVNVNVIGAGGAKKVIPLQFNHYGQDLFSLRLKYPVVTVALDGETTMTTPMPSEMEGMYLEKTDTALTIYYADGTIYNNWLFANYDTVDAMVEAMKAESEFVADFEVIKYGCEGIGFEQINNFDKILLCKEINEVLYTGNDSPTYTGNQYWDSYPTIIRSSDVGFEHLLKISYKVVDNQLRNIIVSFDGLCCRPNGGIIYSDGLQLKVESNGIIDDIVGLSIKPYQHIIVPLCAVQHDITVSDELINQEMHTSTMRMYEILAYLKQKGFAPINYKEYADAMKGGKALTHPVYCLTFDDYRSYLWTTKEIRELFNEFGAKPTLFYLYVATDLDNENAPDYALSANDYKRAKASGWDVVSHGFSMFTPYLSYAQFLQGFSKLKDAWMRWYGEDVECHGTHGNSLLYNQYYLLRHLGFKMLSNEVSDGSVAYEHSPSIDVFYNRVFFLDHEYEWQAVVSQINGWFN